jgi:hypothetical protein
VDKQTTHTRVCVCVRPGFMIILLFLFFIEEEEEAKEKLENCNFFVDAK